MLSIQPSNHLKYHSLRSTGSLVPLLLFSFGMGCAGGVREAAPGATLPVLQVYDISTAQGSVLPEDRRKLRFFILTGDISGDVVLRLQASLRSQGEGEGPTSPWPSTFEMGPGTEADPGRLLSSGYTHLLKVVREGTGLKVTAFALEPKGEREISSIVLSFLDRGRREDAGIDFLSSSGYPLRSRELPAPPLTDDSRQQLAGFIKSLGMGTLRLYSASVSQVFIEDGDHLIPSGVTPLDLHLRSGPRSLVVRRQGQPEQRLRFRVGDGQANGVFLHWEDDTEPGSLLVFTAPEGLRLALNGEIIGESPVARPGVLQGDYEVEVAKLEKDQSQVLITDHISIHSSVRSDRFYPFFYYIKPSGAGLRDALENGLWDYSAPNHSFAIDDFDQVNLPEGSGIVSASIGSKDLQGEILLGPQSGALGFFGEKDRFLVFPGQTQVRAQVEQGGNLASYSAPRKKNPHTYIYFEIDPERKTLLLRADGSTLYDGPYDGGATGRIVCLGTQGGNRLPDEILLRSGAEKKGLFYRWSRSVWPPSQLQKEGK